MVATKPRALPSPSAAAPRIARPGAEARPADRYQPVAAASQLPCPATPVESLPMPALTEPIEPSARALSVSEELWNAAYDGLEAAEAELVGSYVKTLEQILGGETGEPSPTDRLAEMKDPIKRQKHMRELVRRGQDRISNVSKITTKVGEIADFILSSKGIVSLTLQNVPQAAPAALPWAGVCLGLEVRKRHWNVVTPALLTVRLDTPETCPSDEIQPRRYRPRHLQNGLVLRLDRTSPEQNQHCRW